MEYLFIIAAIALLVAIVVFSIAITKSGRYIIEPPHKRAGRRGEIRATQIINSVLREGDLLFTNVSFSFDGRSAELDNVIVNKFGVFIIEVKNYSGRLSGAEDDYEWRKVHVSAAGNPYVKMVKNPIKQVKREIYLLAKHLDHYGVSVWVDGYAMILDAASPVDSQYILSSTSDIDRAIHTPRNQRISADTLSSIEKLLS